MKKSTNVKFLKDLMEFSKYGALVQPFIMQGIEHYCDTIIAEKEEILEKEKEDEANGKFGLVSMAAWVGLAEDVKRQLVERYKQ